MRDGNSTRPLPLCLPRGAVMPMPMIIGKQTLGGEMFLMPIRPFRIENFAGSSEIRISLAAPDLMSLNEYSLQLQRYADYDIA